MGNLEVAWGILATPKEAIDEEARLLRKYYGNHLELPPINRCEPAKQTRKILESLTKFVQAENQSKRHSLDDARTLAEKLVRVSGSFSTLGLDLLPRPGRSRSGPNHGTLVVEEMNTRSGAFGFPSSWRVPGVRSCDDDGRTGRAAELKALVLHP